MLARSIDARAKIRSVDDLATLLQVGRANGQRVVHCHGVFDLLHIGHIHHFQQAAAQGDTLVVTLTPDVFVNKGPNHPVFTEQLRAEAVAALEVVDYVAINSWPSAVELIHLLRPHLYAKGPDYREVAEDRTGGIIREEEAVAAVGGHLFITDGVTFSSSALINRSLPVLPQGTSDYIRAFADRHPTEDVLRYLDDAAALKVLVVGETIIDDYHYCVSIGKSGKEPILAARHVSSERFAGGILAVANHVASFAGSVAMLTSLGVQDSHEEFIRRSLHPKVDPHFLFEDAAPTIVKRRFVESYPLQKLFEVYFMNGDHVAAGHDEALCHELESLIGGCDLVIVNDYGHGMIGSEMVELLCSRAPFLALNTQINAANHGFNTMSKYRRADFVAASETELRLDARSRVRNIHDVVEAASEKLDCEHVIVTQGAQGSLCYSRSDGFFQIPAFTSRIVDRVGAGDAVFAVAALCLAQQAPIEVVGVIGNAVGAEAVMTVGNRTAIDSATLCKHITSLMK